MTTVFAGDFNQNKQDKQLEQSPQLLIKNVRMTIKQTGKPPKDGTELGEVIPTDVELMDCTADAYAVSMGDHCSAFIIPENVPKKKIPYIGVPLAEKDDVISFPLQKPLKGEKKLAPLLTLHAYSFKNTAPGEYDSLSHASSLPIMLSIPLSFALEDTAKGDEEGFVPLRVETEHNGTNTGQKHCYSLEVKAQNFNAVKFSRNLDALAEEIGKNKITGTSQGNEKVLCLTKDIIDHRFFENEKYLHVNNPTEKQCAEFKKTLQNYILRKDEERLEKAYKDAKEDFSHLAYDDKRSIYNTTFAMLEPSPDPVSNISGIKRAEDYVFGNSPPTFTAAFLQSREEREHYAVMRAAVMGFSGEGISRENITQVCNALHPTSPYSTYAGDRCPENCPCDHHSPKCICQDTGEATCKSLGISPCKENLCVTAMRTFQNYLRSASTALNLSITGGKYSFDMVCLGKDKKTGKRVLVMTENTQQPWSAVNSYQWSFSAEDKFLGVQTVARSDDCESLASFQNQLSDSLAVLGNPKFSVPAAYFADPVAPLPTHKSRLSEPAAHFDAEAPLPTHKDMLVRMGLDEMSNEDQRAMLHFANTLYELTRSQDGKEPRLLVESGFLVTQAPNAGDEKPSGDSKASANTSVSKQTVARNCKVLQKGDMASRLKKQGPFLGREEDNKKKVDTRMPGGHSTTIYMHTMNNKMRVFFAESTAYLIPVANTKPVELVSRVALNQDVSPRSTKELGTLDSPLHSSEIAEVHTTLHLGAAASAVMQNLIIPNTEFRFPIVMNTDSSINHTLETFYDSLISAGEYSFFTMEKDANGKPTYWKAGVSLKDVINAPAIDILTTEEMGFPISRLMRGRTVTSMVAVKSCTVDNKTKRALKIYQSAKSTPKVPAKYQAKILDKSLPKLLKLPSTTNGMFHCVMAFRPPTYLNDKFFSFYLSARDAAVNKAMGNVHLSNPLPMQNGQYLVRLSIRTNEHKSEKLLPSPALQPAEGKEAVATRVQPVAQRMKPVAKRTPRFNTGWGHW